MPNWVHYIYFFLIILIIIRASWRAREESEKHLREECEERASAQRAREECEERARALREELARAQRAREERARAERARAERARAERARAERARAEREERNRDQYRHDQRNDYTHSFSEDLSNCYEILGCKEGSPFFEIKQCYLKLIKKFHPDRFYSAKRDKASIEFATQKTAIINDAYEKICKYLRQKNCT